MEYENLKHLQKKKEEFVADTDTIDASSQQQIQTERADSFSSSHSASYQIFYPGDSVETCLKESSLLELQEESLTPDSTTYSHPQPIRLRSPDREENEEGYTKSHASSDENEASQSVYKVPNALAQPLSVELPPSSTASSEENEMSQSVYQVPNAPTQPLSLELPANSTASLDENEVSQSVYQVPNASTQPLSIELPRNSTALIDNSPRESTIQVSDVVTPSHPARRISDSIVSVQHAIGHPVAKKSLSVSGGGRGGNGFQTEPTSVVTKPLIMKLLPLYLCMDDGKVYADQNAASIPTHHLIEITGLEKSIVLQEINQLPPILPPIISKETDPLTHPNPVYETVPRDLAKCSSKVAVVTDQPRIQSSSSLPPETPPPPMLEPSRFSDATPAVATSLVTENVSNAKNDQQSVATQSNVTASTSTHSDHKAIRSAHESSQTTPLTVITSPAAERPAYISTSECYGDVFSSQQFGEVHSYYYFTIVATIVVGLCLDFVVLVAVFLPALWFANKASNSKHRDNIREVKKFGRRALVLNIIGGVLHVLFIILVAIGFITGVLVSLNS